MPTTQHHLSPPPLEELANVLRPALEANFRIASVTAEPCPDLRKAPYHLAAEGLSGSECIADIGGQPNLFPRPRLDRTWSMIALAQEMQMRPERGQLLGAGAGPFHVIGINSELAPNLSWRGDFANVTNLTCYTKYNGEEGKPPSTTCERSPSTDCALMMNLYGSSGTPGPVLKITARARRGEGKSFTECIRGALYEKYGDARPVSMGGLFLIKHGRAKFHVMPDFPPEDQLPFQDAKQLNDWLTYHEFAAPIVCLTVFHSADPGKKLGLRMEHTHCFSPPNGSHNAGGHYHYDCLPDDGGGDDGNTDAIEYEAYFNTAKVIYRIDQPKETLAGDLHH